MYLKEPRYSLLHFRTGEAEAGYDTASHSQSISGRAETKSHSIPQSQEKSRVFWRRGKEGRNSTNASQDRVICIIAVNRSFCNCQPPQA